MTYQWIDPQTQGVLLQVLLDDLSYLKQQLDLYTGQSPVDLTKYVPTFGVSGDGAALTVSVNGIVTANVPIPVGGQYVGPYTVGAAYRTTQIVSTAQGAYIAGARFTATKLSTDVANGNLRLFAPAGINRTGPYLLTTTYNVGDGVTTTSPLTTPQGVVQVVSQWVLSVAAPAGTAPAFGSTYWSLLAGPSAIDTTLINDAANGYGLLSTFLKTLKTASDAAAAAAALNARNLASMNQALGQAGVTGFPITLATS